MTLFFHHIAKAGDVHVAGLFHTRRAHRAKRRRYSSELIQRTVDRWNAVRSHGAWRFLVVSRTLSSDIMAPTLTLTVEVVVIAPLGRSRAYGTTNSAIYDDAAQGI